MQNKSLINDIIYSALELGYPKASIKNTHLQYFATVHCLKEKC